MAHSSSLQTVLDQSVASGDVPFVVAMVTDAAGIRFSGASGEASPGRSANTDTIFRVFSMSKAICATAAAILIDRGRLNVDTAVQAILPEFAQVQVLEGFVEGEPVLRRPRNLATIRHLASHTSGLAYEPWSEKMSLYMERTGHPSIITGTSASLFYPMMTDPGSEWAYGPGVDWLGLVVEAVDGRDIARFCREEIFEPLGMTDTYFDVPAGAAERLAAVSLRMAGGDFERIVIGPPLDPEVYFMGQALYCTAPDYIRLLRMFLNRGQLDENRILSEDAIAFMLSDQTRGLPFVKMSSCSPLAADVDPFPGAYLTHSFGFLRNEHDISGMRSAGAQGWAGLLNSHYWFDPAKEVAAVFMTQSLPFADPRYMQRFNAFERAVYRSEA